MGRREPTDVRYRAASTLAVVALWIAAAGCGSVEVLAPVADGAASDADGDGDTDTDADGDSDGDGDCSEYPAGPYNWFEGDIVPDDTFPGRFGPDGADTGLNMGAAHAACAEVKSLIFAAGAND